jgi:murein DD-endopeptidase MepM/ murein hydrolase activator NlpD
VCLPPPDWIPYTIQQGDTLFGLTLRINQTLPANEQISLETLSAANCIRDPGKITAGETIYVPAGTSIAAPVATLPNGSAATPSGPLSFNCGNPAFTITEPRPGTVLRGTFAIYGTATHPDFQFYRLQVSSGSAQDDDFATLDVFREPVINGQLGIVDTAAFGPGDYWLRLTVVDNTGNYPPQCTIRVSFE